MPRAAPGKKRMSEVDPITVSVIQHRLIGIVEEMGEAMLRTSFSQILNSSRDFSTAICGAEGRLVAQAEHIPVHVGALPSATEAVCTAFGDDVHPGDVFLLNDPYHGGSHLPDLTAFVPVFLDGRLVFWTVNRAHHSDIGGATHGAYNAAATEIWHEGLRVPPIRFYDRGERREDLLRLLETNVRHPRDFAGDLAAQIGSVHLGERRLQALAAEFDAPTLLRSVDRILDATELQVRAIIGRWKDGVYHGEATLDDDGRGNDDVVIRATVTVQGSDLLVDLRESDPEVESFLNSAYANTRSAVAMALSFLVDPEIAKNDGAMRPVEIRLRPGTIVCPRPGAPVTMSTSHCAQEIIEAMVVALSRACPQSTMAGWGRRLRIAIKGRDPQSRRPFIWHMFHARPGAGASSGGDGWHNCGEWHSAGGLKFRLRRGRRGPLPALLRPARVPARFGWRRPLRRRGGSRHGVPAGDRGARRRQHRGRRPAARRARHAGGRERRPPPLPAAPAGRPGPGAGQQAGRDPGGAGRDVRDPLRGRGRLGRSGGAPPGGAPPRPARRHRDPPPPRLITRR